MTPKANWPSVRRVRSAGDVCEPPRRGTRHPAQAFHPDSLVGNIDNRLAQSGLYRPDWPLSLDHLRDEVIAVMVDRLRFPEEPATYARAKRIANVIARKREVQTTD